MFSREASGKCRRNGKYVSGRMGPIPLKSKKILISSMPDRLEALELLGEAIHDMKQVICKVSAKQSVI